MPSTLVLLQGTFTPSVHAHAGRTQGAVDGQFFPPLRGSKIAANFGVMNQN